MELNEDGLLSTAEITAAVNEKAPLQPSACNREHRWTAIKTSQLEAQQPKTQSKLCGCAQAHTAAANNTQA